MIPWPSRAHNTARIRHFLFPTTDLVLHNMAVSILATRKKKEVQVSQKSNFSTWTCACCISWFLRPIWLVLCSISSLNVIVWMYMKEMLTGCLFVLRFWFLRNPTFVWIRVVLHILAITWEREHLLCSPCLCTQVITVRAPHRAVTTVI